MVSQLGVVFAQFSGGYPNRHGIIILHVISPVVTLPGHLWSNVCSNFHVNRGILKPISRNHDVGVFFLPGISWNPPRRGIFWQCILSFLEICQLSIVFNEPVIVQYYEYTMMLERVFFEIVQTNKLSLYYELENIYKYSEKSSFKPFSFFLKNNGLFRLLKGFDFFYWFRKKTLFLNWNTTYFIPVLNS